MEITEKNSPKSRLSFDDTAVAFANKTNADLYKTYLLFTAINNNFLVKYGSKMTKIALNIGLPITFALKKTIFGHFCGGTSVNDCSESIDALWKYRVGTILDYSVEGEKTEKGFDRTLIELLAGVAMAEKTEAIPFTVFKITGLARFKLLERFSESLNDSSVKLTKNEWDEWEKVKNRVDSLCGTAAGKNVRVLIDAEETWIQPAIDFLALEMMEKYNLEQTLIFNTYQMYCRNSLQKIKDLYSRAEQRGFTAGLKLVRGAYMEKERARAEKRAYPDPIQPNKNACDADFDAGVAFCVSKRDRFALCAASHNEKSNYLLTELMEKHQIPANDPGVWFAQLYGMSDHISYNLSKAGYNVAKYLPYGPVKKVMPYLFRRAEENTSVAGQSSREFRLVKTEMERRRN